VEYLHGKDAAGILSSPGVKRGSRLAFRGKVEAQKNWGGGLREIEAFSLGRTSYPLKGKRGTHSVRGSS